MPSQNKNFEKFEFFYFCLSLSLKREKERERERERERSKPSEAAAPLCTNSRMPSLKYQVNELLLAAEIATKKGKRKAAKYFLSKFEEACAVNFPKRRKVFKQARIDAYNVYDNEEFKKLFGFKKEVYLILEEAICSRIGYDVKTSNRIRCSTRFALLVLLLRLTRGFDFETMASFVGGSPTSLGFIFHAVLSKVAVLAEGLRNLTWTKPRLELYRHGISRKTDELNEEYGYPFGKVSSVAFLCDGSDVPVARPSPGAFPRTNLQKVS